MKRLSLVLTLAALTLPQAGQAATWLRTYGGSGWDEGRCVQEVEDGYIVTGGVSEDGYGVLWLSKTDSLGDTLWSRAYRGTATSAAWGNFVQPTIDGGYAITGVRWMDTGYIWLLKTDSKGDTLWTKTFDYGIGYCLQQTFDGGYILTGVKLESPRRLVLIKTDSLGEIQWKKTYIMDGWVYSWGYFVQQTDDAGYIIAGLVEDIEEDNNRSALWLIRTNSIGDTLWSYMQGGDNWGNLDNGRCVRQTKDMQYVALANFALLKVDGDGDSLWTRGYQGGSCVQETENNKYALTGEAGTFLSSPVIASPAGEVWLLNTDSIGDSMWKRNYFGGRSYYVDVTQDKGFIVTGYKNGDIFLLKTDSLGLLGIAENPIDEADNGWNVPHSIGSYIVLHYQGLPQGFQANVFDISGRKVDKIRGGGNEGAMTWGVNYPPGVYFIQALDNRNQLKTAKVVLVR